MIQKTIKIFFLLLLLSPMLSAQIAKTGKPYSWSNSALFTNFDKITLPGKQAIPESVQEMPTLKNGGFAFAHLFEVNKGIWDAGVWTDLPNGDRVWQMLVESEGAYSLSVNFSRFLLPEGAQVFIFNQDKSQLLGAFTSANNKLWQRLAVQPISGNSITIEYYEPQDVAFEAELTIGTVGHDFLDIFGSKDGNFGRSGDCNIDINCDEGNDWQTEKRAVCRLVINGSTLCSGALINNSAMNQIPYVLSANHCIDNEYLAQNTVFVFNYESTACNGTDGSVAQSISGAELIATKNQNVGFLDFTLLKLSKEVPLSYKPYFAGWDSRITAPKSGTTIHHPWGDVKKISHDYDELQTATYIGYGYDSDSFWKILEWDVGTTEGGSSGSPLFDQNHRIVGSLTGGDANCISSVNDYYQKVSVAFDRYDDADSTQLKYWLVPDNSGISYMDGLDPLAIPDDVTDKINVIHWEEGQQLAFYVADAGGYLSGNNVYQDKQKAEFYNKIEFSPLNAVTGAYVAFAYATGTDDTQIEMRVLQESFGFPSTVLGSSFVSLGLIKDKADVDYVYFSFDPAIEVNSSIYLSLVLPQTPGDTVALMTVEQANTNTAWEQNYESNWYPYSDSLMSWDISLSHIIALEIGRFAAVDEIQEDLNEINLYPNPAKEQFTVESINQSIHKIELYDAMGRLLKQENNLNSTYNFTMDIASVKSGIYLLLVYTENKITPTKVVIE
jgi:V8-like Glu-specific endopeptidase